jgi:hypothetical protein
LNIIQMPTGLQKVVFTPDDIKALLLTAAQTQLGLDTTAGLQAYLPEPVEVPAVAGFVTVQPTVV